MGAGGPRRGFVYSDEYLCDEAGGKGIQIVGTAESPVLSKQLVIESEDWKSPPFRKKRERMGHPQMQRSFVGSPAGAQDRYLRMTRLHEVLVARLVGTAKVIMRLIFSFNQESCH